jgi:hypothetical protein
MAGTAGITGTAGVTCSAAGAGAVSFSDSGAGSSTGAGASGAGSVGSAEGRGSMTGSGALAGASLGFGAGFGTAVCLNMLAQVVFVPWGIVAGCEAAGAALGAAVDAAGAVSVAVGSPQAAGSSVGFVFHSDASSVGIERGSVSLGRAPLVVPRVDLPRAPPRPPRSVARPRPRPVSAPRPPRAFRGAPAGMESPVVVVKVSALALGRARSFLGLETSPHCEMVPVADEHVSGLHL